MSKRTYEYKCVVINENAKKTAEILNKYGSDGWKLVSVWNSWHYLSKKIKIEDED